MTSTAEILADLRARLRSYDRDEQPGVLLDKVAQDRAVALCTAVLTGGHSRSDATALSVLGEWFLRRYLVLPVGTSQADLRSARVCAGLLRDLGDSTLVERLAGMDTEENLAIRTSETALSLLDDFDISGDARQVASARNLISTLEGMLDSDHPLRGELFVAGGHLAAAMFTIHGDPAHGDEAVRVARAAVTIAGPDDPRRPDKIVLLTHTLLSRYGDRAAMADLDEAQALAERLVAEQPADPPPNAVAILAAALCARFERTRRISDLDRAIVVSRDAIGTIPSGHPTLALLHQNLLACLLRRAEHLGQDTDLTDAIETARIIRSEVGPAGPLRCGTLTSLAILLVWRYVRTGGLADLTEAEVLSREAVALSTNLRGMRTLVLTNHAILLWIRFMVDHRPQELTEAIEVCREALAANPRSLVQAGVVRSMLTRLLTLEARTDDQAAARLDEALEVGRTSVAQFSPGHPLRAIALSDLAGVYRQRHHRTGDRADLDTAVGLWRSAVRSPAAKPGVRMQVARDWLGELLRVRDLPAAAEPAKAQVDLLPVVAWRGLDRTGREQRLAGLGDVATTAAALAIELDHPEQAVELLEQGRSVLWTQAIQTRSDLSALHAAAPGLAAELDSTRRALDRMTAVPEARTTDRAAHAYRELVERWDTLLADARAVPGFADFLGTAPFETLRTAATGGVVVIVNVAQPRCDALIVRPDGVSSVPLPWLTLASAERRAAGLLSAITELETDATGPARTNLRQTLTAMLRWLWDTVAAPVIEALDADGAAGPHRVWWCPTGPLTLLPLHAAGRYGRTVPRRGRRPTVPDRTVSSYTTSLTALLRANRPAVAAGAATMVAVGMPHTEGKADLPAVSRELDHITATVPGARALIGPAATPNAVLAELARHRVAHFACHATQDVAEPSRSALHLAGADLSVSQLATLDLTDAELAYLSACRTAGGTMDLADEAINLAAALQLAGYRNVIGTLWSVSDHHAAAVANSVYRTVTSASPADYATALTAATAELRTTDPDRPDIWAPFIHLGG